MSLLPAWAPNVHPLLVHFPIGLLVSAALFDLALIVFGRHEAAKVVTGLYLAGTTLLVATYLSGRSAARTVLLPGMAHGPVDDHWRLAAWCLGYFVALTGARLVLRAELRRGRGAVAAGFVLAGLVGLALLAETAGRGGRLVYEYGVGVVTPAENLAVPGQ